MQCKARNQPRPRTARYALPWDMSVLHLHDTKVAHTAQCVAADLSYVNHEHIGQYVEYAWGGIGGAQGDQTARYRHGQEGHPA